jgi:hypothetical protein
MPARHALNSDEIARSEVLDACGVEGYHRGRGCRFVLGPIECRAGPVSQLGSLLPMMTEREFRRHHEQVAARLRSVAATATTSAVRARIIEQAEAHERLARQLAELGVN